MVKQIKIVENKIAVDTEKLKNFIIKEWQSGNLYNYYLSQSLNREKIYRLILGDIAEYADKNADEIELEAQDKIGPKGASLDWIDKYPKSDPKSIGFEVLNFLQDAWHYEFEKLTVDDIPVILEFLDTPPGKSLEAWDKWEKYWKNLDYAARRKKLLENEEK